jgi:catechol 2,3-dioxygenase-like lactoylglutathione lyase family enzyme
MARIKSISGLVFKVKDLNKTRKFYEDLEFRFGTPKGNYLTAYINWFWVEFHEGNTNNSEFGVLPHINVDDIDEFHKSVVEKGMKPEGEPRDLPSGRREFTLPDPDGYRLVFFTKK